MKIKDLNFILATVLLLLAVLYLIRPSISRDRNPMQLIAKLSVNDEIPQKLEAYREAHGHYPASSDGLGPLGLTNYSGSALLDPWGRPYQYRYPSIRSKRPYDIWSLGPDQEDEHDDIGNWK